MTINIHSIRSMRDYQILRAELYISYTSAYVSGGLTSRDGKGARESAEKMLRHFDELFKDKLS